MTQELPDGTAIILFIDIVESVALTEEIGDVGFRKRASEVDTSLRVAIREGGGTPVEGKVLGDGVMAVYTSAKRAIDGALLCREIGNEARLPLHLGIHAGDVVREGNTLYGGAVNLAQRVADVSGPGEILVTDTVRGLARTSTDVVLRDQGRRRLKGIPEPQHLFAVEADSDVDGPTKKAAPPLVAAFRTVMFTDTVGSMDLFQRLGDAGAMEVLEVQNRIVGDALRTHNGTAVKNTGDGVMAAFESPTNALQAAIAMQRELASLNESSAERLDVRIGVNAGEPVEREGDLFGTAVNLANRIAYAAEGGEILVSEAVRQLVMGKGFLFADRGDIVLTGFEDLVRLYELRWQEQS